MKRLRVRLKAQTPSELKRSFRHRIRRDGVDIPARGPLTPGEDVEVVLVYRSGEVALHGRGRVAEHSPSDELRVDIEWSARFRSLVETIVLPDPEPGRSASSMPPLLSEDLEVPSSVPLPAPVDATEDVLQVPKDLLASMGSVRALDEAPSEGRAAGEVTPLARIELVRRSPPPIEMATEPARLRIPVERPTKDGPPELEPKGKFIIGVDLGSHWSRAAIAHDGEARLVPSRRGNSALPSVVHIDPLGRTFVGETAERRSLDAPEYGIRLFRRLMGRAFAAPGIQALAARSLFPLTAGPRGETAFTVSDGAIPLEEAAGILLKEIRESSAMVLSDRSNRAVLTVPGWSGPQVRESMRMAAEMGGIHVERMLGEAAAAAVDYAHRQRGADGTALVVSLGAGHLDLALVDLRRGTVRSRAVGGTPAIGGVDFDRALQDAFIDALEQATGERPAETPGFWSRLGAASARAKEELGEVPEAVGVLEHPLADGQVYRIEVDIRRAQAESQWEPLLAGIEASIRGLLESAEFERIDRVLAAGGQMQTPAIRSRVHAMLPSCEWVDLPPDAAVSGAALVGERIRTGQPAGVSEVSRRPWAVAVRGGSSTTVFDEGTSWPSATDLTLELSDPAEIALLEADPSSDLGWTPIGLLDLESTASGALNLRLNVAADGQLGVLAELPGQDWRPLDWLPVVEWAQTARWVATAARANAGLESGSAGDPGIVGWLRRRLRSG